MKRKHGQKPEYQLKIARERIAILFDEAEKAAKENKDRAKRYVQLARKIGMRYNVRIPHDLKRKYCRYCHNMLLDSRRRLKKGVLVVECKSCGASLHYPYKGKRDYLQKA